MATMTLVLAGCAMWGVHRTADDPARWDDVVRAYAAADSTSSPPVNAIAFTGSSSIVRWTTLKADMAPLEVMNRGFGGSTMNDALYWIDTLVLKYKPRAIVIYEGDNDIGTFHVTPEEFLATFKTLASRIHTELPETRIYFLAVKPSIFHRNAWEEMKRANGLTRSYCETRQWLTFVDVASPMLNNRGNPRADIFEVDGLHLNTQGYAIWTSVLKPILLEHESVPGTATNSR